jgi:hypothetical protein
MEMEAATAAMPFVVRIGGFSAFISGTSTLDSRLPEAEETPQTLTAVALKSISTVEVTKKLVDNEKSCC